MEKKVLGDNHPAYALSLNNLASDYNMIGDYRRAEPLFRQVLEIGKKVQGERHRFFFLSLYNLAWLYQAKGDYRRAEPLFRQALEIQKKVLGENHADYARSLHMLAHLYQDQRDYPRAEPLFRQAATIFQTHRGNSGNPVRAAATSDATGKSSLSRLLSEHGGGQRPVFRTGLSGITCLERYGGAAKSPSPGCQAKSGTGGNLRALAARRDAIDPSRLGHTRSPTRGELVRTGGKAFR